MHDTTRGKVTDKPTECLVSVYSCAPTFCILLCAYARQSVRLFSSTQQFPTQASVGLQREMRWRIERVCFDPLSWKALSAVPVFANTLDAPGILHRLIPLLNTFLMHCICLTACFCDYVTASAQIIKP